MRVDRRNAAMDVDWLLLCGTGLIHSEQWLAFERCRERRDSMIDVKDLGQIWRLSFEDITPSFYDGMTSYDGVTSLGR